MDFPAFDPHPLLLHRYLMTAACALPRTGARELVGRQERRLIRVDTTTQVAVDLDRPERPGGDALVLVHGMVGSSSSSYMLGTAHKALARGHLVARLNIRNCGGTEELTSTAYNGGLTDDVAAAARALAEEPGIERVHLIGFSLGGNMVLKLAAEWGSSPPPWLRSIATVSPCVDFAGAARALNTGLLPRFLQRQFVRELKILVRKRHELGGGSFSLEALDRVRTVREFDDAFTAPLSGYADADDYYARASVGPRLDQVHVPTLMVAARDDPLVPFESFERHGLEAHRGITLLAPEHGGHVGFVGCRPAGGAGWEDADRFWAENRALQFVSAHGAG